MTRRFASVVVGMALIALSAPAMGSVEGSWGVEGKLKIKLKIQGVPAQVGRDTVGDVFTFHPDGSFEMIDGGGSWTQNGAKFIVNLDAGDIETFYEQMMADAGFPADVTITKLTMKGKERSGKIKGKLSMKMDLFVYGLGAPGKVKAKYKFKGFPVVTAESGASGTLRDGEPMHGAFQQLIRAVAARIAAP